MNTEEYKIYLEAVDYFAKGDNEKGIKNLEFLSQKQNKRALYELGIIYSEGKIVNKNIEKAINLLTFSGELGFKNAYFELGKIYLTEKYELKKAERYILKSGNGEGYFLLGQVYFKSGINNGNRAFRYFYEGMKKKNSKCTYYLAKCYLDGIGVSKDIEKATMYLKKAFKRKVNDEFKIAKRLSNAINLY